MNKRIASLTLALVTALPTLATAQSEIEKDPAFLPIDKVIDLKSIVPEVNVNLPRFLLMDAASGIELPEDNPFAAAGTSIREILEGIKLVRVVILEAEESKRAELDKGVAKLRKQLEDSWIALVSIPEDNIGIYAISDPSGETMAGLAILISDGGEVIFANIVGKVSIGKVMRVASQVMGNPDSSMNLNQLIEQIMGAQAGASGNGDNKENSESSEEKQS